MAAKTYHDYYNRYWTSEGWPESVPRGRCPVELRALIARYINRGATVLDAGCGNGGKYGEWLASRAGEYVGVDVSEQGAADARARGLNARAVEDLTSLDFPDSTLDACVCIEVLEHLVFPQEATKELYRVLKPGGVLIATVPNIVYWRRRMDYALLGRWHPVGHPSGALYPWRDPHLRFFTQATFRRMLAETGFAVERVEGIDGSLIGDLPGVGRRPVADRLSRPFRFLQDLAPSLFGANLAAVVRKPASRQAVAGCNLDTR